MISEDLKIAQGGKLNKQNLNIEESFITSGEEKSYISKSDSNICRKGENEGKVISKPLSEGCRSK